MPAYLAEAARRRRMDMSLWLAMVAAGVVRWERLCAGSVSCVPLHVWECGE
jgi:hypothetical protein